MRIANNASSLLDLVFVDRSITDYHVSVEKGFSNHLLIFVSFPLLVRHVRHLSRLKTVKKFMRANDGASLNYLEN